MLKIQTDWKNRDSSSCRGPDKDKGGMLRDINYYFCELPDKILPLFDFILPPPHSPPLSASLPIHPCCGF